MAFEGVLADKLFIKSIDVEIYDPVAHKLMRYFTNADHSLPSEPIATVRDQLRKSEFVRPVSASSKKEGGDAPTAADATKPQSEGTKQPTPPPAVIDVPMKGMRIESIDGVTVVGHRTILKYGRQKQFFQIEETWFSPDYALDVRRTILRENFGTETVETKDIVEGEPDPALFRIPPGYIVRRER